MIRYRIWQLWRALSGRITDSEQAWVRRLLGPGEQRLFARMARFDQRHCLDVAQTLARAGYADPTLLRAALLHDCGKVGDDGRPIPLLLYGAFVVVRRLAPGVYARLSQFTRGPLRWFHLHAAHEQRSVTLVAAASGDAATLVVLRDLAAKRATPQTRLLAWADDQV